MAGRQRRPLRVRGPERGYRELGAGVRQAGLPRGLHPDLLLRGLDHGDHGGLSRVPAQSVMATGHFENR